MKTFISANLSLRQRIILYRYLRTLSEMDFSYLRPVVFGTAFIFLLFTRFLVPESCILARTTLQVIIYRALLVITVTGFVFFVRPYIKKLIMKHRINRYRH